MIRSTAVACAVLLLTAASAVAQWRTLQSPDEESGETVTLARANGLDGHLSLLVTCQQGYYILALGFDDDVKFDHSTVEMRWDGGPAGAPLALPGL